MTYISHLTYILSNAAQFPEKPCFKLPQFEPGTDENAPHRKIIDWKDVTYGKFLEDINLCAAYWIKKFQCPPGSIIGLWMLGMTYRDFVHLFGLLMAKYVPQLLNLKINSVDAAITHFKQSNISHVIYAPGAPPVTKLSKHFQVHGMDEIEQLSGLVDLEKSDLQYRSSLDENGDDILMIYHTSGSTTGRPKLVRFTRQWIDANARKPLPGLPDGKEINIAINGISHLSQLAVSLPQFGNAACTVLLPWNDFTGAELVQIIQECKANVLYQLTPISLRILREAMTNAELESALRSLEYFVVGGAALGESERLWALEKGLALKNMYGSTEMGITMVCGRDALTFHPFKIPGLVYEFRSADKTDSEDGDSTSKLVEFVIPPASLDHPDPSLCDPADGYYHSKDLFEKVESGGYKYRGRSDDMIIMNKGQMCDTLYLEDQIALSCKELISACVVVGSGKPSPTLLAEPAADHPYSRFLKEEIGERVKPINQYGFPHERIHPSHVLIVSPGAFPRTPKGNVIRAAAERMFRGDIDALFNE